MGYQLAVGNGVVTVKRSMIRFGDRHLIPHLFPGQDANQEIPKRGKRKNFKSAVASKNWDAEYKKPEIINVEFPVDVFLRMRPLIGHEIDEQHKEIKYSIKKTKKSQRKKFILSTNQKGRDREYTFKGLKNIILPKQNNEFVFKQCIMPCIDALFAGTPCAAFAYGHSGSGKTHTMFGYGKEAGLHRLFAQECLQRLNGSNMFLEVRLVELYQSKLHDLLCSDVKQNEITLRQTKKRGFIFRQSAPKLCEDGKFRQYPITTVRVLNAKELQSVLSQGIASRNVGNSTIHSQSSRSHAFLEYEIVNDALCQKRKELMELETDLRWYGLLKASWHSLKNNGKVHE